MLFQSVYYVQTKYFIVIVIAELWWEQIPAKSDELKSFYMEFIPAVTWFASNTKYVHLGPFTHSLWQSNKYCGINILYVILQNFWVFYINFLIQYCNGSFDICGESGDLKYNPCSGFPGRKSWTTDHIK